MASTKVGDGLSYQAALRWVIGCRFCNPWAARVVQEKRPSRAGVVRAMARSGPLALGLHAQVGPHLLKGDLQLPAQDKPFQNLGRVRCRIGTEQSLGGESALGVSDQHPANEDGRLAGAVPDRRLRVEFHRAGGAVVPGHLGAGPSYVGVIKEGFQWWPPRAFQGWPAILTRLTGRRCRIEGGVQAQSGDEGDGFTERLAAVEQVQHGVAVVPHQDQGALGQPAAQLHDHLSGPVGEVTVQPGANRGWARMEFRAW